MADDVRQRMIRETALSLARKGLQRSSFSEILEASGAPRGSLYHHFPGGKNELVLAALAAASEWMLRGLEQSAGTSVSEVARAFVDLWRNLLVMTDFGGGCAVAAVTVAADSPTQIEAAAAIFRSWRARLASLLSRGGAPQPQSDRLAAMLIAACEGAVVLARAERSFETFDLVAAELMALTRAAEGSAPDG